MLKENYISVRYVYHNVCHNAEKRHCYNYSVMILLNNECMRDRNVKKELK